MAKSKYVLTFSPELVNEPITFRLAREYDLLLNVLRAQVDEGGGTLIMEMEGDRSEIEGALEFLVAKGVKVQELNYLITRDEDRCTDCSMCLSICPAKVFRLDRESWNVTFEQDRCIACGLCTDACPRGALRLAQPAIETE